MFYVLCVNEQIPDRCNENLIGGLQKRPAHDCAPARCRTVLEPYLSGAAEDAIFQERLNEFITGLLVTGHSRMRTQAGDMRALKKNPGCQSDRKNCRPNLDCFMVC